MTTAWRGKALIADDDPRNRKLMNTLLRAEGYEVRCVESGAATLAAIADEVPDVLLLDLMMPGMDGFEVVRRLKAGPATRSCSGQTFLTTLDLSCIEPNPSTLQSMLWPGLGWPPPASPTCSPSR